MSFERVRNYIKRHKQRTFVVIIDGRAKCMPSDGRNVDRLLRGIPEKCVIQPVGFYEQDCPEIWIAEDLMNFGIGG